MINSRSIFRSKTLTANQKLVYLCLCENATLDGIMTLSLYAMSHYCSMTQDEFKVVLRQLRRCGLISYCVEFNRGEDVLKVVIFERTDAEILNNIIRCEKESFEQNKKVVIGRGHEMV
jgi:hypothetical protein